LGFSDPEKEKKQDVVGYIEVAYGPEENAHGPFKSYGPGGILWVSFLRNLGGNLMFFFLIPFHAFFFLLSSRWSSDKNLGLKNLFSLWLLI